MSTGATTEYAGNFIYEDGELKFFSHPEGYTQPDQYGKFFDYVYQYKDHLGNIRLTYADSDGDGKIDTSEEIISENNYYPFGLKHKGYNEDVSANSNSAASKYMFGGKEFQDDDINGNSLEWYDVTARNYDPALGRWMNLDPLAELMRRHSPYNYAFNNPLVFVDPDGMAPFTVIGADEQAQENIKNQLPEESQKYVKFDENGELDADLISEGAKANPESSNLKRLAHLANSEDTYVLSTSDHYHATNGETDEIETKGFDGSESHEETAAIGVTIPKDKDNNNELVAYSIDENSHLIVSNMESKEQQAKTTAHEVVHAFLIDLAKFHGSKTNPYHSSSRKMNRYGELEITRYNPPGITEATNEAAKNYKQNNKDDKP